jgi:AraC family transcriptional regulator of adaptative response/methylated-DNA-[protein]-cysteine methyltransferase
VAEDTTEADPLATGERDFQRKIRIAFRYTLLYREAMNKLLRKEMDVSEEARRWHAVLARDARLDGAFVYAVRSTGIYCRPSCSSRRPKRAQVLFFGTVEEAEQMGFRPCRRCRPQEAMTRDAQIVQRACQYIEAHLKDSLTLATLSAQAGLSPHHFQRLFKRVIGVSPRQYVEARRLSRLKENMQRGEDVMRALYAAGYSSSSRLYERSNTHLGMTPATYRRKGQGMRIHYTIMNCPLGRLLIGATNRGICTINIGEDDAELEAALQKEYAAAQIQRDPGNSLTQWISTLLRHLEGRQPQLNLPVDIQATAFQRRVWEELRRIPYGQTRSYSEIARIIGQPKATRAVARACATNPVPIVIPCHRVVRADGGLGGYGLGIERKRVLLQKEGAIHRSHD